MSFTGAGPLWRSFFDIGSPWTKPAPLLFPEGSLPPFDVDEHADAVRLAVDGVPAKTTTRHDETPETLEVDLEEGRGFDAASGWSTWGQRLHRRLSAVFGGSLGRRTSDGCATSVPLPWQDGPRRGASSGPRRRAASARPAATVRAASMPTTSPTRLGSTSTSASSRGTRRRLAMLELSSAPYDEQELPLVDPPM